MALTSLQDVRSLPDPLQSWRFDLIIPNIPGGGNSRQLKIQCQTTQLPGMTVDPVVVALHGAEIKHMGRQVYTKTLQATFMETNDLVARDALRNWLEFGRDIFNGVGRFKADYATTAEVVVYDDVGAEARSVLLHGFYPETIGDAQMDGSGSNLVTVDCTFSYDYHEEL